MFAFDILAGPCFHGDNFAGAHEHLQNDECSVRINAFEFYFAAGNRAVLVAHSRFYAYRNIYARRRRIRHELEAFHIIGAERQLHAGRDYFRLIAVGIAEIQAVV